MKTLTQEKARALASDYLVNGFDKGAALRSIGCSLSYSKSSKGCALFDRDIVKEAMAEIVERNAEAVDLSVSEIIKGFKEIAFPADGVKVSNADRNCALMNLAKIKGMFRDNLEGASAEQKALTREELIEAQVMCEIRLKMGDEIRRMVEERMVEQGLIEPPSSLN